ncbi:intermembrane lipid transfer protein Vps13-like [Frankliniella occidentalis]|uniref:Intermembrane lipid transfer protein Vps13-like n=1 Tax=Frankliniella occidentalis TaxID=133901 RepID=A0A9C6WVR5_FRAOC|nr:intermembrane lipid transfer protein Vps13-like [Frankliniella occidentalis]
MYMTKPFYGELRRRYNPAFWMQLRRSEHLTYCRMSIHRLQLDNQQPSAHFPTVLCPAPGSGAPAPAPAQAARRALLKPCVDLLVLRRARPAYRQNVYKYVKVVVQEFSVQLERDFLDALLASWAAATAPPGRPIPDDDQHRLLEGLRQDVARSYVPVHFLGVKLREAMPRPVIESVHLSPLRIRLSLFLRGSARTGGRSLAGKRAIVDHVFNALVPSAAEIKNVRLKLPYFERKGVQATCRDVAGDAQRHYYAQLVQQVHVMVLGLDVLGNPYGLVSDFTDGFGEFFYEPYMGTIESPDEFAEDLSRAAQALLGNLTGAEASGLSLLAPSLGAMLTNLTFEDEYKKKRRFCLQQATDLPELARTASKTFSMGVLMGLSGVVLKPSLGAPQEGVEGFFRGTGKGFLGLMTKPGGGVVDCIATAHDGIRRATEMGEDMVMRARLPRHLNPYQGLRPFSVYEATGQHLLSTLSRGHYADSDLYWAHAALAADGKTTMLITLQHVFLLERCRQWGPIEVDWAIRVDDIMEVPKLELNKLVFIVRQDDSFSAFSGDERSVTSEDPAVLAWLRDKVETVLVLNMEDRPVPATT